MKLSNVLLILATIVCIFSFTNGKVNHGTPDQGEINYCNMCNVTTNCSHGTDHNCVDVTLGKCSSIINTCDNSKFYTIATQEGNTVSARKYQDANCTTEVVNTLTSVSCGSCSSSGEFQVLCANDSSSASLIYPSIFLIVMILISLIF
ncbi:hypothetical protein RB653_003454 [Dictyostelium firmibasis]|uniref:Uncharacterized protein n=1 Tax=Dictyostelium firmibasis TaxID=79012 RepID=A0AAN7TXR1_9MYCE